MLTCTVHPERIHCASRFPHIVIYSLVPKWIIRQSDKSFLKAFSNVLKIKL